MPVDGSITWVRVAGGNELVKLSEIAEVQTDNSGNVFVKTSGGGWRLVHEFKEGTIEFQKLFNALDLRNAI